MALKIDDALVGNLKLTLLPDYHPKVKELFSRYINKLASNEEIVIPSWDLGKSAKLLMQKQLPEPKWAVYGLLAEGSSLFIGPPKVGKSYFCLQLATRVGEGKPFLGYKTRKGKVLYIALEDEEYRIQNRLFQMGYDESGEGLENVYFEYTSSWKRFFKKDGVTVIKNYLKHWDGEVSLVIIDTLQRFRGLEEQTNGNLYGADYEFMNTIQELGSSTYTPILSAHHTKKAVTGDYVTDASGTNGISGGCDHVFALYRERLQNHAVLRGGGRDVAEVEKWVIWDDEFSSFFSIRDEDVPEACKQQTTGSKEKVKPVELVVFEVLSKRSRMPLDELISEVGLQSNIAESSCKRILTKMVTDGYLYADGKGDRRPISIASKAK